MSDICEISSSKRIFAKEYAETGIPFYRGKEITLKSLGQTIDAPLFITFDKFDEIKAKYGVPIEGDILMTAVGTIGNVYYVSNEKFYFKDGNVLWFKNFKEKISHYVFDYLNSNIFKKKLDALVIGSTQKALTINSISKMDILLPTEDELNKYERISTSLRNEIERLTVENSTLASLRETLLPKLMSGEIDVSNIKL